MQQLINITISDFKLIFRDPSLRVFLFLPILILGVVYVFLPYLAHRFEEVMPYVPYVLMASTVQAGTMFGFVYCMVFIDEKDTQVARIYGVLPMSRANFTALRLLIPMVVATLFTLVLLLIQPFYSISMLASFLVALSTSILVPIMALSISVLARNKMEGMTWYKIINLVVTVPLVAFFVPDFQMYFGVLPTYWAFVSLGDIIENGISISLLVAFVYLIGLSLFLLKKHLQTHFSQ